MDIRQKCEWYRNLDASLRLCDGNPCCDIFLSVTMTEQYNQPFSNPNANECIGYPDCPSTDHILIEEIGILETFCLY